MFIALRVQCEQERGKAEQMMELQMKAKKEERGKCGAREGRVEGEL